MEAEKCRKYPGAAAGRVWRPKRIGNTRAQREKGYRGRKVQKIPGRSGKKGIEAEKCRKYPGRSGRKGMEAEKDRKYPRHS